MIIITCIRWKFRVYFSSYVTILKRIIKIEMLLLSSSLQNQTYGYPRHWKFRYRRETVFLKFDLLIPAHDQHALYLHISLSASLLLIRTNFLSNTVLPLAEKTRSQQRMLCNAFNSTFMAFRHSFLFTRLGASWTLRSLSSLVRDNAFIVNRFHAWRCGGYLRTFVFSVSSAAWGSPESTCSKLCGSVAALGWASLGVSVASYWSPRVS